MTLGARVPFTRAPRRQTVPLLLSPSTSRSDVERLRRFPRLHVLSPLGSSDWAAFRVVLGELVPLIDVLSCHFLSPWDKVNHETLTLSTYKYIMPSLALVVLNWLPLQ